MILLLGKGYIAQAFAAELTARKKSYMQMTRENFDLESPHKLNFYFRDHRFEFVINAAGYAGKPNVDTCEDQRQDTFAGNVLLPVTVANACSSANAGTHGFGVPFAHVSSGCLYNGYAKDFTEEDPPNFSFFSPPCSYYSGTKALAEQMLPLSMFPSSYIWRLRLPFDEFDNERNYLSKLLRYPRLIDAQNSLSHRGDFVKACLDLWQQGAPYGTYNITNPGHASAAEITTRMNYLMKLGRRFNFFIDLDEFNQTVVAPRSNCILDTSKLEKTGVKIRNVWEALEDSITRWKAIAPAEITA